MSRQMTIDEIKAILDTMPDDPLTWGPQGEYTVIAAQIDGSWSNDVLCGEYQDEYGKLFSMAPGVLRLLLAEVERLRAELLAEREEKRCAIKRGGALLADAEHLREQADDLRNTLVKGHGVMDNAETGIIALEAENERLNIAGGIVNQLQAENDGCGHNSPIGRER